MAKLLYVGRNDWNVKGISSKAYIIRRRARTVYFKYGSVQSIGGCGGQGAPGSALDRVTENKAIIPRK